MEFTRKIVFLMLLSLCAWHDWKQKEIPLWTIMVGSVLGILFFCLGKEETFAQETLFWRFLPGICFLCIAVVSEGKIGLGDGLLVSMSGFYLTLFQLLQWILVGSVCCGIYGSVLILMRKRERRAEFAYAPFLWISALTFTAGEYLQRFGG